MGGSKTAGAYEDGPSFDVASITPPETGRPVTVPGSVQQSPISSQFAFQCCNLPQLKKIDQFILICNAIFNFEEFKMGFKCQIASQDAN